MLNHINGYDAINTLYQTNLLKSVFLCNDGGNTGISGSDKTAMVHSNLKRGIRMTFLSEKYFIPRMEEENYHDINSLTSGESAKVFRYATLLASSRHLNDISNKDNPNDNNNNSNPKRKAKRPVLLMEDILSKISNKPLNYWNILGIIVKSVMKCDDMTQFYDLKVHSTSNALIF